MDLNMSIIKNLAALLMLLISFVGNSQEARADSSLSRTFFGNVTDEKTNRSVKELKIEINHLSTIIWWHRTKVIRNI